MKKGIVVVLLGLHFALFGQMQNPVSWKFESKKVSNTEYKLIFSAEIEEGSALYSQEIGEGGPVPTQFTFEKSDSYTLVGKVVESKENREIIQDPMFEMELAKFHDKAVFTQKIKVKNATNPIKGEVTFMSCNGSRCIPPKTIEFSIDLLK